MCHKMRRITLFIWLALTASVATGADDTVTLVNDPWSPFIEADGSKGLALDIVREALQSQHIQVEVLLKPWARALKDVSDGKNDLLLATWQDAEREQKLIFSEPYLQNRLRFIKRSNDPFDYRGLESLNGKRIGVVRDYSYTDEFANNPHFIREPHQDLQQNLKMLEASRLDLTLEDEIVASYSFHRLHQADKFQFTGAPLVVRNLYLTAGRSNPKGQQLIQHFNQGLEAIMNNGRYEEILAQYGAMLQSQQLPGILLPDHPAAIAPDIRGPLYVSRGVLNRVWPTSDRYKPLAFGPDGSWQHSRD